MGKEALEVGKRQRADTARLAKAEREVENALLKIQSEGEREKQEGIERSLNISVIFISRLFETLLLIFFCI